MARDPGLVMRWHRLDDARQLTGEVIPGRYYCLEMRLQGKVKASARKARVTDCMLDDLDVSPPSLYILG